jgi:hypothetical protein
VITYPAAKLIAVLDQLAAASVRAIALKGPAQAALLWGDPAARPSRDLDLLVPKRDVRRAVAALEAAGFRARPKSNGVIRELHIIRAADGLCVDLHWNPAGGEVAFPHDFEQLWTERQVVRVHEARVPFPAHPWLVVLTSLYFVRELPWVERRYLRDLARLVERFPDLDWRRAEAIARQTRTVRLTTLALELVRRAEGVSLPTGASAAFPLDPVTTKLVTETETLLADPRAEERAEFVSELKTMLGHGRYREVPIDRLRPWLLLPAFLLLPDDKDADRAAASGRSVWSERLLRLPEVARAFTRYWANQRAERAFEEALQSGNLCPHPAKGLSLHPAGHAGLLLYREQQQLYQLDAAAAVLWHLMEKEGGNVAALTRRYGETVGIEATIAGEAVKAFLGTCWRLRLLERPRPQSLWRRATNRLTPSRCETDRGTPNGQRADAGAGHDTGS